jgi:hypothetical protein
MICWNEEHATLLATKWYDHKKLAELGEMEGTFKFSTIRPDIFETYSFQALSIKRAHSQPQKNRV